MSSADLEVYEERASLAVAPHVTAAELVQRLDVIQDAMKTAMQENVDYGVIPGTGSKPTLLKPGAEKLGALFQLDVQLENEKTWHDDGHLTVVSRATVFHQPTGARLGSGEGICTTREAKYAYRTADRVCPNCGKAAIIKGKAEYGGGWLCWAKRDGCGAKFADGEAAIESQPTGKVANENLADTYNTVDKMASKRARIDAVLAVTGASALFTQDIEDFASSVPDTAPDDGKFPPADALLDKFTALLGEWGRLVPDFDIEGARAAEVKKRRAKDYGDWLARQVAALEQNIAGRKAEAQESFPIPDGAKAAG